MNTTTLDEELTPLQKELRRQGRKQKWLAEQLGIDPSYLSRLLRGWVPRDTLKRYAPRIAELLGVPMEQLFPQLKEVGAVQKGNGGKNVEGQESAAPGPLS